MSEFQYEEYDVMLAQLRAKVRFWERKWNGLCEDHVARFKRVAELEGALRSLESYTRRWVANGPELSVARCALSPPAPAHVERKPMPPDRPCLKNEGEDCDHEPSCFDAPPAGIAENAPLSGPYVIGGIVDPDTLPTLSTRTVREAVGFLTAELPELHHSEVPKVWDAFERGLNAALGLTPPAKEAE